MFDLFFKKKWSGEKNQKHPHKIPRHPSRYWGLAVQARTEPRTLEMLQHIDREVTADRSEPLGLFPRPKQLSLVIYHHRIFHY